MEAASETGDASAVFETFTHLGHLSAVIERAAGVAEVGPGVTEGQLGDRVMSHFYSHWLDGGPPATNPTGSSAARSTAALPST
ncbi:hypothetical protein [Streptomyces peucetius]|nr:hypothetical protein CGZ69_35555 [Streptomyces peucetius subsp. caesius ATCC 27952]